MKRLGRAIAFGLIMCLLIGLSYRVLSWKDTMGGVGSSVHQLDHTEKNLIDVVFVGTSHVFCGIMPGELWNDYGIASFDMSVSGMDKDSEYYQLKRLLQTQSPKIVFVDMFPLTYDKQAIIGNEYRNMLSMPFGKDSFDLINAYAEENRKKDYWLKWPIIHSRYKEITQPDFYDYDFGVYGRGEGYSAGTMYTKVDLSEEKNNNNIAPLSERNKKWLDDLKNLSEEYSFKLVFFATPARLKSERQELMNAAAAYAKENGIDFIDGNKIVDKLNLDMQNDFGDMEHLNMFGGMKFSKYLGEYINNLQIVDNRKEDSSYEYWNLDAMYMAHTVEVENVKNINVGDDTAKFLDVLSTMSSVTYIVSLDGKWYDSTLPLSEYVETLGIHELPSEKGNAWVVSEGQVVYSWNEGETEQYYDIDKYTTVKVKKGDNSELDNVMINNNKCCKTYNGINIIVYDNMNRNIILSTGLY